MLPDEISFSSRLTQADWDAFVQIIAARPASNKPIVWGVLLGLALVAGVGLGGFSADSGYVGIWLAVGIVVGAGGVLAWLVRRQREMAPSPDGTFFAPRILRVSRTSLVIESVGYSSEVQWRAFLGASASPTHLFLWLDRNMAHVIAFRELPADIDPNVLVRTVRGWIDNATGQSAAARQTDKPLVPERNYPPSAGPSSAARNPTDNGQGPNPSPTRLAPSAAKLLALIAICILTWVGLDWFVTGPEVSFELYGAPGILWNGLPVLLMAWVFSRVAQPQCDFRLALALVLLTAPFVIAVNFLLDDYRTTMYMIPADSAGVFLWFAAGASLMIASKLITGAAQSRGILIGFVFVAGFYTLDDRIYVNASLWYPTSAADEAYSTQWEQSEQLLFSHAERIDAAVSALESGNEEPSAFFVGFAGYGEEKVFAEEIKFAAGTLGALYGSSERSLLLLNDARSTNEAPIASVSGLEHGLKRIAERMDTSRDLLILALSSHGSAAPSLSVSNGPLPLRDLDGELLRAALDDAGIKWRLLIISACFAGSFIDVLANPHTAIVTSAAPDKTSFGCSNDRELTYFGEAFYRDALPRARTLREAFDLATADIILRETQEGISASEPKAFFGADIEAKLLQLRRSTN